MKTDDAPFYLAVNNVKSGSGKPWLKKAPVGVNKLNTLMKTMAQKAGLGPNFKNHSSRKTMIQTLVNNDVRQLILCNCQDTKTFKVSLATPPSHRNNS